MIKQETIKCKECCGTGELWVAVGDVDNTCENCHGMGELCVSTADGKIEGVSCLCGCSLKGDC